MDEKTKILIALGAATAANCIPCFDHLHDKAYGMKINDEEISDAVEIATKVKNGAHVALKNAADEIMRGEDKADSSKKCECGCA